MKEDLEDIRTALRFIECVYNVELSVRKPQILEKDTERKFINSIQLATTHRSLFKCVLTFANKMGIVSDILF